jgi:TetR/AcrR family transcriptional regulator, fatty acid metabolism regulator protein
MERPDTSNDVKKEKQAAIFEAACKVIRDKGFHQARITDIAQQAGISYGLVYHYFGSKGHLYEAILEEWWGSMFNVLDACDKKSRTVNGKLRSIVDHFLNLYEERPNLLHIFITEISRSSTNLTPERRQFFKTFFDKTEKIMAGGQSAGELRKDIRARYLTYIFLGAVESFLSTMVLEDLALKGPTQKERIANGLLEVFFNGAGNSSA